MSELSDFFTREKANEGTKLHLSRPDGSASDHWIMVRHSDSDAYRAKEAEVRREVTAAVADGANVADACKAKEIELIASLVAGWSFTDVEFNLENVIEMLKEAPAIYDGVNKLAGSRASFFGKGAAS